jgi:hypothetical protein
LNHHDAERANLYGQLLQASIGGTLSKADIADIYFRAFCVSLGLSPNNDVETEVMAWVKEWTWIQKQVKGQ